MAKKKKKIRRSPRKKPIEANTTTAIVKVEPPSNITVRPQFSIAPRIKQMVEDTERIRRFVSQCLNTDYQHKAPEIKKQIAEMAICPKYSLCKQAPKTSYATSFSYTVACAPVNMLSEMNHKIAATMISMMLTKP